MNFWTKYNLVMMLINWIVGFWFIGIMSGFHTINWFCFVLGFGCAIGAMNEQYQENEKGSDVKNQGVV